MRSGISLALVCEHFSVEFELLRDFAEFGLYQTALIDGELGVELRDLDRLGRIIGLHEALGIEKEGIEVILELRDRISALQEELESLRSEVARLRRDAGREDPGELERLGLLVEL